MNLSNKTQKEIVEKIVQEVNPSFILLFGSHAKGTYHEHSDIDLAYFSHKRLSSYERFLLAGALSVIAGCNVDLIDVKEVDTVFAMQIYSQGKLLLLKDENEYTRQQMRAYSMYVHLNEQRSVILDNVKESGKIYDE